jgi:ABC-type branched-subunit amino acid transport system substrate-binding protein
MHIRSAPFLLSATLLLQACGTDHWHLDPTEKHTTVLKIAVFGSSAGNEQNYSSIQEGASLAQQTDQFKAVSSLVQIVPMADAESTTQALSDARKIRDDPDVLAVVGHSYSGTTRAVLPVYAQGGIPLMIPAATSPYVTYKFDERGPRPSVAELEAKDGGYSKFDNAFRLIPSDVPSQVEALEATARRLIGISSKSGKTPHKGGEREQRSSNAKTMLICDTTKRNGSDVYTKPICDSLREGKNSKHSIARYIAGYKELDVDTGDIWALVTEIHALMRTEPRKLILFVGYPELARVILEELKERSLVMGEKMSSYTFVMSEACLTNDLLGFGASIYVTSPFNTFNVMQCLPGLKKHLKEINVVPSAEAYSFDAIVILSKAIGDCKERGHLDRGCVRQYVQRNGDDLQGLCETYRIGAGERRDAPYYVYASCRKALQPRWEIGIEHEEPYEKWPCTGGSE